VSVLNLGVTGHRHLSKAQAVQADVERALLSLEARLPGRPLRLFSSLAEGADRIVARQVLTRRAASLVAVLPMPRQQYVADFLSSESRDEFSRLVEAADDIVELPLHETRGRCYEQAGLYVLDHSDVLIAVWDGLSPRGPGGTGDVVAGAIARRLPVLWIQTDPAVPGGATSSWL
jgi:hypothetical protein